MICCEMSDQSFPNHRAGPVLPLAICNPRPNPCYGRHACEKHHYLRTDVEVRLENRYSNETLPARTESLCAICPIAITLQLMDRRIGEFLQLRNIRVSHTKRQLEK